MMQPFLLIPACKETIWGGKKLKERYGKTLEGAKVAESWELSAHPSGQSRVAGGPFDGLTLTELIEKAGPALCGRNCARFEQFPVLIKLIDAADNLSVQVHPGDEYALRVEGEYGKTELWHVLEAEPEAYLYFGFRRDYTRAEVEAAIADGSIPELLNRVYVKPGDTLMVWAGTVHAIGAGVLLAEIQQNSATTYRVYDFGRVGADGKPRELHVKKALDVAALTGRPAAPDDICLLERTADFDLSLLGRCDYFDVRLLSLHGTAEQKTQGESFHALLCTAGGCELSAGDFHAEIHRGETYLVPADCGSYLLRGEANLLLTAVPSLKFENN